MKGVKQNIIIILSNLFYPVLTYAQIIDPNGTLNNTLMYFNTILSTLNPILFSIAFIVFFWGLSKYILNSEDEQKIKDGKNYMFWGILALFILVSFRAIITFITSDLGLGNSANLPLIRRP